MSTLSKNKEKFSSTSTTPTGLKKMSQKYREYDPNGKYTKNRIDKTT